MMLIKDFFKNITPPVFLKIYRFLCNKKYGWHGNYENWGDVQNLSTGYNSDCVFNKVKDSLLRVKIGEVKYERDGVIFEEIQYNWEVLSFLMFCSAKSKGVLSIVDFGGSLGSTYYQNNKFLKELVSVHWSVIEQSHFVDEGVKSFQDESLHFYYSLEDCVKEINPNILLLSSVLQYIEKPYSLIEELLAKNEFEYVIIDRTPFVRNGEAVIKHQIVDPAIYEASYPCWFFNYDDFVKYFESKGYSFFEKFKALDGCGDDYQFYGMFFVKRK